MVKGSKTSDTCKVLIAWGRGVASRNTVCMHPVTAIGATQVIFAISSKYSSHMGHCDSHDPTSASEGESSWTGWARSEDVQSS